MTITRETFCNYIEMIMLNKEMDPIEATLEACTYFNVDVDGIKEFINKRIIQLIEVEASKRNLCKFDLSGNLSEFAI